MPAGGVAAGGKRSIPLHLHVRSDAKPSSIPIVAYQRESALRARNVPLGTLSQRCCRSSHEKVDTLCPRWVPPVPLDARLAHLVFLPCLWTSILFSGAFPTYPRAKLAGACHTEMEEPRKQKQMQMQMQWRRWRSRSDSRVTRSPVEAVETVESTSHLPDSLTLSPSRLLA